MDLLQYSRRYDAFSINDAVMGGLSSSLWHDDTLPASFSGRVSLANHGGFASIRTLFADLDISDYCGLQLLVKGDNKQYKLNLIAHPGDRGVVFQQVFFASSQWRSLYLPLDKFVARRRGQPVDDVMDPKRLGGFGLVIAGRQPEFEAGEFQLLIQALELVSTPS
ncbi:CIA30 family protein [Shewanella sp. NIFS-20-20]|uniref:CIA30 family protein n=1 Tax=Shewanella sp. NIFS-20-20 TaxID=2853806 RepID=UPI001C48D47C|nr:CIA30 family protein [Shewanella sp. NIFS-20-20]MBV7314977.1 CIA30 family protein [Shewanella sp. NIFS-20-20]